MLDLYWAESCVRCTQDQCFRSPSGSLRNTRIQVTQSIHAEVPLPHDINSSINNSTDTQQKTRKRAQRLDRLDTSRRETPLKSSRTSKYKHFHYQVKNNGRTDSYHESIFTNHGTSTTAQPHEPLEISPPSRDFCPLDSKGRVDSPARNNESTTRSHGGKL